MIRLTPRRQRKPQATIRDVLRDGIRRGAVARGTSGALRGAAIGGTLLAVGLIRIVVALLTGAQFSLSEVGGPEAAVTLAAVYVVAFAAAGAAVGVLWPLRRAARGPQVIAYLAAGIVVAVLGVVVRISERDGGSYGAYAVTVVVLTAVYGTWLSRDMSE
jgi:flagellar biosynthesis protein FliQ